MANTKLMFYGTEQSKTEDHVLQCYSNPYNEIYIEIHMDDNGNPSWVVLDESTAIKLAKTLRTEINKIKDV